MVIWLYGQVVITILLENEELSISFLPGFLMNLLILHMELDLNTILSFICARTINIRLPLARESMAG